MMKKENQSKDLLKFMNQSPLPWWQWNVAENIVTISPLKVEMLGYNHQDFLNKGYQAYTDLLHPDDYKRTMQAMTDMLTGQAPIYQVDYRIRAIDNTFRWYMDRGFITERLPDQKPLMVRGIVINLGEHIHENKPEEELISILRKAVPSDRTTNHYLSMCSNCLKIHSENKWIQISENLSQFIDLPKSHGICPDCMRTLYPKYAEAVLQQIENDKNSF